MAVYFGHFAQAQICEFAVFIHEICKFAGFFFHPPKNCTCVGLVVETIEVLIAGNIGFEPVIIGFRDLLHSNH